MNKEETSAVFAGDMLAGGIKRQLFKLRKNVSKSSHSKNEAFDQSSNVRRGYRTILKEVQV